MLSPDLSWAWAIRASNTNRRHNMGFLFVDELLREAKNVSSMSGDKFRCELWKAALPGSPDQWLIAKPQTFMNLSGECVQPLAAWHRLLPENILVVHDELDIARAG
mgnify:CR=1 FL=1